MADRFLDFIDMIDGGGAGTMGDKFEGGGIFSMLANALATPYGSEDKERMRRVRQMRGLLAPDESISPRAAPRPTVTRGGGAGQAQVRPQARPAPSMTFGNIPVGGGMPAAPSMTFGNTPVGGGMPAARAAAPSVQSEMALPANTQGFTRGGLAMRFGMPLVKDETFFEPFGRSYRKGFSDVNLASDMVAPTMVTPRTERGINSPEGTEALRVRAALRSRFPFATEQEIDQAMKMSGM